MPRKLKRQSRVSESLCTPPTSCAIVTPVASSLEPACEGGLREREKRGLNAWVEFQSCSPSNSELRRGHALKLGLLLQAQIKYAVGLVGMLDSEPFDDNYIDAGSVGKEGWYTVTSDQFPTFGARNAEIAATRNNP